MNQNNYLDQIRGRIFSFAKTHGAKNIRLFGSFARGEANDESDIDLLVEMEKGRTYLDFVGFWQDLEEDLHRRVDVVTDKGLSPYLKEVIQREARPL